MRFFLLSLPLLAAVAACAPHLTQEPALIRVTSDREVVKGCKFVGNVEASDWAWGQTTHDLHKLQTQAAELHANVLFLTASSGRNDPGATRPGEAYAC